MAGCGEYLGHSWGFRCWLRSKCFVIGWRQCHPSASCFRDERPRPNVRLIGAVYGIICAKCMLREPNSQFYKTAAGVGVTRSICSVLRSAGTLSQFYRKMAAATEGTVIEGKPDKG